MKAVFRAAVPYARDALDLPVRDVESAIAYYERTFGFRLVVRKAEPHATAILERDLVRIGLSENGRDPEQEGCFFEVDDIDAAFEEIHGRPPQPGAIKNQDIRGRRCRAFFVVAPDGLCYLVAQPAA